MSIMSQEENREALSHSMELGSMERDRACASAEEWLLRHIYPADRSAYYRDTYTKLRSFLEVTWPIPE